jgi:branched-chain amino acid aminotransferase
MQNSARRACLPEVEPEELLGLLEKLCAVDAPRWLTTPASSLYIRPTLIGTEPSLGLKAPREAILFIVLAVWPIPGPNTQLHLITNEKAEVRAWPGGTGSAKLGANYGPSIAAHSRVSQDMKADGASGQVLWLFGPENRVTEAGASNFFVIWKNPIGELQMVTPPVEEGLILPGVMRQAVLDLARERLSGNTPGVNGPGPHPNALSGSVAPLVAEEAHFTMRDIVSAADEGRLVSAFTTGTAVFIIPVVSIRFEGREIDINSTESPYISLLRTWLLNIAFGGEKSPWAHIIDHCV